MGHLSAVGIYADYINMNLDFAALTKERQAQLETIASIRERDVLVYAADLNYYAPDVNISINQSDVLPIHDQIDGLTGSAIDIILETPGGSGEVPEDIVKVIRGKYDDVAVIVPGTAKSAGTLITMAANEILMEPNVSCLGPIDAQLQWQGKVFSADALLQGIERIKDEVDDKSNLNQAYIPMLQGISPGELEHARNALDFAKSLVRNWLESYKFANWDVHSSNGNPVTDEEKKHRASEIAQILCDHRKWLTHGRSIRFDDLSEMGLQVTDYSLNPSLADAIRRYFTLCQMTFEGTPIYKLIETPTSGIFRAAKSGMEGASNSDFQKATADVKCSNCQNEVKVQAVFDKNTTIDDGCVPFPPDSQFKCPKCGTVSDLTQVKSAIEAQAGKKIVC